MEIDLAGSSGFGNKPAAPEKILPLAERTAKGYDAYCGHKGRDREINALLYRSYTEATILGYKGPPQAWLQWIKSITRARDS